MPVLEELPAMGLLCQSSHDRCCTPTDIQSNSLVLSGVGCCVCPHAVPLPVWFGSCLQTGALSTALPCWWLSGWNMPLTCRAPC